METTTMKTTSNQVAGAGTLAKAFTLIELLVVLATMPVLAAMLGGLAANFAH